MSECRTIFDYENTFAADELGRFHPDAARHVNDLRGRVIGADIRANGLDVFGFGRIHLVDDNDRRAPHVDFTRVVRQFMAGTVWICHHDFKIGSIERCVVVSAVPENYVGFLLSAAENSFVVHARVYDRSLLNMGFVFFPLFDRAFVEFEIFDGGKALDGLGRKISVWHRVPNNDGLPALAAKFFSHKARDWAFAATGPNSTDGNDWNSRFDLSTIRTKEPKVSSGSHRTRREMHQRRMRNIAIGKDNNIHAAIVNERLHVLFIRDENSLRIARSGEFRGIAASRNVWDLSGSKCYDVEIGIIAKYHVR